MFVQFTVTLGAMSYQRQIERGVRRAIAEVRKPAHVAHVARWTKKSGPTLLDAVKVSRLGGVGAKRGAQSPVQRAWADARPNLGSDWDQRLWHKQRIALGHQSEPFRNYDPPPKPPPRDVAALVDAPRPGPLAGIARLAA